MHNKQNIVITGGNRGIGYGLLKILSDKHNVIITVRDNKKGQSTVAELGHSKNEINYDLENLIKIWEEVKKRAMNSLAPALRETIELSERSDFCVGYFNLRGWKSIDSQIEKYRLSPS